MTKKEKHCDRDNPDDDHCGDCWDYVALDPEHRLVVSALVGRHSAEHVGLLVEDFHRRTEGRLMNLMTSDENPAYAEAILATYGAEYPPRRKGQRGQRPRRRKRPPKGLKYATVHKTRENNRVVKVEPRVVYGNVPNRGLIANLPASCVVEVPCLVDRNGVQPTQIGTLPPQLAALMQTNINVQELTVDAALTGNRERVYQAALLDPHTAAALDPDQIVALVDELVEAHGRR